MDVRGTAPVYIPPAYPIPQQNANGLYGPPPPVTTKERQTGKKIKIAVVLTVFFVVLQMHYVLMFFDRAYSMIVSSPYELANEYGCVTSKGILFVAILFFIIALLWLREL